MGWLISLIMGKYLVSKAACVIRRVLLRQARTRTCISLDMELLLNELLPPPSHCPLPRGPIIQPLLVINYCLLSSYRLHFILRASIAFLSARRVNRWRHLAPRLHHRPPARGISLPSCSVPRACALSLARRYEAILVTIGRGRRGADTVCDKEPEKGSDAIAP